jgi:diaminohydroxyphosphoribosylaminopyrimidine deaminase/5-amino-6-(5-phosphoribosylamino)uracil reductase
VRQPRRVVFDSEAALPLDSALVRTAPEVPLILVVSRAADRARVESLRAAGAEIVVASGGTEEDRVCDGLEKLGALEVQSMLLEGGPHLAGAFLDAGEVDEMRLFIAPIALGGRGARMALEGTGTDSIADARRALHTSVEEIDGDVLITARFKEW